MIAVFLHPIGWGAKRVIRMCGADSEAFYPAECSVGKSHQFFFHSRESANNSIIFQDGRCIVQSLEYFCVLSAQELV